MNQNLERAAIFCLVFVAFISPTFAASSTESYKLNLNEFSKINSFINLYKTPVTVEYADRSFELQRFDIKFIELEITEPLPVKVLDVNGDLIEIIEPEFFVEDPHLGLHVLSEEDRFCFFSQNLSNTNGSNENSNPILLTEIPRQSFYRVLNQESEYIFPGRTSVLPNDKKDLIAFFPIECALTDYAEEYSKAIEFFLNYGAEEQREYYDQRIEEIQGIE